MIIIIIRNKLYRHNPEFILENEMHKVFRDFDLQTDHQILTRPSDSQPKKKRKNRTYQIMDFAILADHRVKLKESEKRDKYLNLARELKKTMEHEGDGDTSSNECAQNNPQMIGKEIGRLGNKRMNRDHPDYSIIKISQNTEKSPGDLRLTLTQTPGENHQLMLVLKTLKEVIIMIIIIVLNRRASVDCGDRK